MLVLRDAERWAPQSPEVLFLLGRALRRTGDVLSADDYLKRAAQTGWPAEEVRQQRYLSAAQTANFELAGRFLAEALAAGVDDDLAEEIYEAQARGLFASYRLSDALLCIEYWLKWRPHARQALLWRADIRQRSDGWPEAIKDYQAIINHDPHDYEAHLRLGNALLYQNDARAAAVEYEWCLATRPNDSGAKLGAAKCQRRLGDIPAAEARLTSLLDTPLPQQERGETLYELGEMALYARKYEQAVKYLTEARDADPTNRFVHRPLAAAYVQLGKVELADESRRRGDEATARSGRVAELTGRMLTEPQNADLRYETGTIFLAEGLVKEGVAWLESALRCDANHQGTHAALAEHFEKTGDLDKAEFHRQMATGVDRQREREDSKSASK